MSGNRTVISAGVSYLESGECERPLISFCLLTYNQESFIREAVEAALAQTYSPLEIIISDDCSVDNTFSIVQELVLAYDGPHKVVLNRNHVNIGLVPHVNKVFGGLAKGLLLVAAAGDDVSLPERTEELWRAWEESDRKVKLVSSARSHIDLKGNVLGEWLPDNSGYENGDIKDFIVNPSGSFNGASAMYHRDVMDVFGPLEFALVEDGPLIIRSRMLGPIFSLPKKLVKYRISENNLTGQLDLDYKRKMLRGNSWRISIYDQIIDDLGSEGLVPLLGEELVRELMVFGVRHKKKHELLVSLARDNYFVRIVAWFRLAFVLPKVQSIDNIVYWIPDIFYSSVMKYGLPSESRFWRQLLKFKKALIG